MKTELYIPVREEAAVPGDPVIVEYGNARVSASSLENVSSLARSRHVRLRLVDVRIVPYGETLNQPTVSQEHLRQRLEAMAREANVPFSSEIVYARDFESALCTTLAPGSLVLLATKRSWWQIRARRFAARLRKLGHRVLWVGCD